MDIRTHGEKIILTSGRAELYSPVTVKQLAATTETYFLKNLEINVIYNIHLLPEAGISNKYCAKNSGSPEAELRFCPWLILFKY
jgi:hypothetical protein